MKEIETPYTHNPYKTLSLPDKGALPNNASRKQVNDRWDEITIGHPNLVSAQTRQAWGELRSPAKRIGWDIFFTSFESNQQSLQELLSYSPAFNHQSRTELTPTPISALLVWEIDPQTVPQLSFPAQEDTLSLSELYDDPERLMREVRFDI